MDVDSEGRAARRRERPRLLTAVEREAMEQATLRMHEEIRALLADRPRRYVPRAAAGTGSTAVS